MKDQNTTPIPEGLALPAKYALRTVRPTTVTPVIDGRITPEEWGDTPDFHEDRETTEGKRTYLLDQYDHGQRHVSAMDVFWRYDDEYFYTAVRITEPAVYETTVPGITKKDIDRGLTVQIGNAAMTVSPKGDTLAGALGNMCCAYTFEDGVRSFEFAAPRAAAMGDLNAAIGYVAYTVTIHYDREVAGVQKSGGFAYVRARTTPMFADESFSHDVFVLAEGTPAPAPSLDCTAGISEIFSGDVKMKDGVTLRFSEPTVLAQGPVHDQIWGHYQFPHTSRLTDGSIRTTWSYSRDTIEYKDDEHTVATHAISYDNGKTWVSGAETKAGSAQNPMPNGKNFAGFRVKGAYKTDYIDKYTPAMTWGDYKMYFAEDIEETVDKVVSAFEYDPKTGETTEFECRINWPNMPLVLFPGGFLYPTTMLFALCSSAVTTVDDVLYLPMYSYGFDAFAADRESAKKPYSRFFSVFFFRSTDCGRTWDLLAQIPADEHIVGYAEGPCEPEMTVSPDGTFVMLIRTGSNNPSYIARSKDKGETWSVPEKFDDIGVFPQILSLKCGVTIATYGRPTMRFAATDDPSCETWAPSRRFPLSVPEGSVGAWGSCYYTELFPLDDKTALFVYSDFFYPNEYGAPAKAVLVRTITVVSE